MWAVQTSSCGCLGSSRRGATHPLSEAQHSLPWASIIWSIKWAKSSFPGPPGRSDCSKAVKAYKLGGPWAWRGVFALRGGL